jgi:predicted dehydrogenase
MTLRVGFIGCGGFARRYHVPALLGSDQARIAAVLDPGDAPALAELCATAGAARVDALPALLGAVDAVIVSTPHTLHASHAAAALGAGLPVLVDKPFVMTAADAIRLADDAGRRGLVAGVAFNRRFDRGCLRAREMIRAGAIGRVRYVETVQLGYERAGWFLDPALGGGGPFTGRATHMADLIPWLLGRAPTRLAARVRGGGATRSDAGGFIDLQFGELECRLTCVEEGWRMWDEVRVFGETGLLELRRPLDLPIGWELRAWIGRGEAGEVVAADPTPGAATRNFVAAVAGREAVACSFAEALVSVRIVEEAFASAASGGAWRALG